MKYDDLTVNDIMKYSGLSELSAMSCWEVMTGKELPSHRRFGFTVLSWLFMGRWGLHRIYLGHNISGYIMAAVRLVCGILGYKCLSLLETDPQSGYILTTICFSALLVLYVVSLVDLVLILTGQMKDCYGRKLKMSKRKSKKI